MAEQSIGHYPHQVGIDAYGNGGFRFAEMSHRGSLLCLPTGMHAWSPLNITDIDVGSMAQILALSDQLDVLFIGTGEDIAPIPADVRKCLKDAGITVEAIGTGSAISIYNIMFSEQRAVGAALLAAERKSRLPK